MAAMSVHGLPGAATPPDIGSPTLESAIPAFADVVGAESGPLAGNGDSLATRESGGDWSGCTGDAAEPSAAIWISVLHWGQEQRRPRYLSGINMPLPHFGH